MYGQQQYGSRGDYMVMLVEEIDKLFNELINELVDEIVSDCVVGISPHSLPLLSPSDQEDFPPKTS
jgi:hypothetical protein